MEADNPRWYYRIDDDPMNLQYQNKKWDQYPDRDLIEKAYSEYTHSIRTKKDDIDC